MEASLEALIEKQAITDLIHRYATALDTKDWALLDECFVADARLDYESAGGPAGPYQPELRDWLIEVLEPIPLMQHLVTNIVIELDGKRARARVYTVNVNRMGEDPEGENLICGGIYYDRLEKGALGWRFTERAEERTFVEGVLPELNS